MGQVNSTINLQDNFSAPLRSIMNSMNAAIGISDQMQKAMAADVDTSGYKEIQKGLDQVSQMANQAEQAAYGYSAAESAIASEARGNGK